MGELFRIAIDLTVTASGDLTLTPITQMDANSRRFKMDNLTRIVIGCSFEAFNTLGRGFLEKDYANSLAFELINRGIDVEREHAINVFYKGERVGEFFVDLWIENRLLIETKATSSITNRHIAQCLNYLKASDLNQGLSINFGGPSVEVKRLVNNFPYKKQTRPNLLKKERVN